jgi:hypothetical protein
MPNGWNETTIASTTILAATNDRVQFWNDLIQEKNPKEFKCLISHDIIAEVDDTHGHLKKCINETVMNKYVSNSAPPHILNLKVCYVYSLILPLLYFFILQLKL